jgi:[ribosomal protein S5]-alanine N-acetyltransferase
MRPTGAADGERAFEIQSDWDVARMLAMAAFPPDRAEIERWFAEHSQEWLAGSAYRFAAVRENKLIGVVDIASVSHREGALGYWFDRAVWGLGYATEATRAIVKFAFDDLKLSHLRAGHAFDNAASARVLRKLGFQPIDNVQVWSRSRGEMIIEQRYRLGDHQPTKLHQTSLWPAADLTGSKANETGAGVRSSKPFRPTRH